eukprot:CAMPEP_0201546216 /NCGR_PEP_ID=MMETSP0173_2-20130828/2572_1 /ASSEMBLY_ACC=CAM_ASM_000268 /TAXON_ID=218659 /ORGANISM="Vexillifera sp., Strain DIVA3 564/2" /LENGTH=39 /DNA_ID= /DNA_START= /DNA_END= /DNA_ORIENTATION=
MTTPKITPITIPAISPPDGPESLLETVGSTTVSHDPHGK